MKKKLYRLKDESIHVGTPHHCCAIFFSHGARHNAASRYEIRSPQLGCKLKDQQKIFFGGGDLAGASQHEDEASQQDVPAFRQQLLSQPTLYSSNIHLPFLALNTTYRLQPCDASIIQCAKMY